MSARKGVDDIEDSLVPPYLLAPKEYASFKLNERMTDLQGACKSDPKVKKWRVLDVDYNAWRRNSVDERTIYNLREASVLTQDDLPLAERPVSPPEDALDHIDWQYKRERGYIDEYDKERMENGTNARRLNTQVMQKYNKPLKSSTFSQSYGAPRSSLKDDTDKITTFAQLVRAVRKKQTFIKVPPPSNVIADCARSNYVSNEFCDVLGPISCNHCIENANKQIVRDVEATYFPKLDCTATALVAPSLSKGMLVVDKNKNMKRAFLFKTSKSKNRLTRSEPKSQWQSRAKQFFPKLPTDPSTTQTNPKIARPGMDDKQQRVQYLWETVRNRLI